MLTLKIKQSDGGYTTLKGLVGLDVGGTLDGILTSNNSIELTATRQLSGESAANLLEMRKKTAMAIGGSLSDDNFAAPSTGPLYEFVHGYRGIIAGECDCEKGEDKPRLLSINHVTGEENNGCLDILPSDTIDVSVVTSEKGAEGIAVSRAPNVPIINKLYHDINKLVWRLYHCYNSLSGRLQLFFPEMPVDGSVEVGGTPVRRLSTMGRYLGTFMQYQTLVTRWNHYAWSSSFYLDVVEAGPRLAVTVGYTAVDCKRYGPITYSVRISIDPDNVAETTYNSRLLTLYNQGTDSTISDGKNIKVETTYVRTARIPTDDGDTEVKSTYISGTGYEGSDPHPMDSVEAEIVLSSNNGDPVFLSEQYHRTMLAVAPCIGIDKEYKVQPGVQQGDELVKLKLIIEAEWEMYDTSDTSPTTYTKTVFANVDAVGIEDDTEDDTEVPEA